MAPKSVERDHLPHKVWIDFGSAFLSSVTYELADY